MGRLRRRPGMEDALRKFPGQVVVLDDAYKLRGVWHSFFSREGPIFVELGTGKGQFLRSMAQLHPEACFIGMEREPGVLLQAVRKADEMQLKNLKFVLCDVQNLPNVFGPAEIDGLYIHFCDPWPKSRHAKRRLTHADFLTAYKSVLSPNGTLHFKTDNQELFAYSLSTFEEAGMELLRVSEDLHAGAVTPVGCVTEYEAKFSAAGLSVCYCEARFTMPDKEEAV
jgi:tRNA (guanine-N7-)-methyltransferase